VNTKAESTFASDVAASHVDFAHLYHLLLSKVWVIILFGILSLGAAIGYILWAPKIYESTAVIEVGQETPKVSGVQDFNTDNGANVNDALLKTVEQALTSATLLLHVAKTNGLDHDPLFAPPKKDGSAYLDTELVNMFRSKVAVRVRRGSRLIDVTVGSRDPKQAQQLASSMIKEFVNQSFEQEVGLSVTARDALQQEADHLKAKLQNAEQAVQKYREDHDAVSLEDKQNITVEKLKELNLQVTEAKNQRLKLEADLATIEKGKVKTPEDLLSLPSVAALPIVADLRKELAEKAAVFKADGPMAGLRQTLNRTLVAVRELVKRSYEAAKITEDKLSAALQEQEQAALELNKIAIPYHALVREVDADRALYESVLTRMKVTNVAKGIWENNIRVVESPLVAIKPAKPAKKKILALALLGGCVLGCGLVVGRDIADSSIRSVDQAEKFLGFPVLTSLPESKRKNLSKESALTAEPASHEAEAFRSLRTALSLLGREQCLKTVLFTSANPAEGKTYCCLNYAVALAQLGLRTLLVDADLRRKNLSKLLLLNTRAPALTSCLSGRAAIADCCRPTGIETLFILGAGGRPSKPAELLASGDFATLLKEALLHFDRIVIDSSPINPVSDTQLIVKHVHSVCLVIRARKTPRRAIVRACSLLAHANHEPDGIVFNRTARRSPDSYYFSQYGHEYIKAGGNGSRDVS
jgi:capsular exopolysaccharide synthesis family protein